MTVGRWTGPALAAAALSVGAWVSFRYAFTTWYAESDAAEAYVLWSGVRQHGLGFLGSFSYAQDNWLLWPLPAFFAAFAIVGDAPWVSFAVGWAMMAGCAGAMILILRRPAGLVPACLAASVFLLSARATIGEAGFLSYPLSHNASLLLGLLSVHAAIRWIQGRRPIHLLLGGILLLLAGLSDPWTEAAFTLPIGCAALYVVIRCPKTRAGWLLGGVTASVLLLDHTRVFGLFGFLQPAMPPFAFRTGLADVGWLARYAALWFGFVPHWNAAYGRLPGNADIAADLALLLAGLATEAVLIRRAPGREPALAILVVTGASSVLITAAADLLLDIPNALSLARFFVAAYVFAILGFTAAVARAWPSLRAAARASLGCYALLLPLAGLASAPASWARFGLHTAYPGISPFDRGVDGFAAFLQAHGLTYGYGSYWRDEANAVAWLTRRAVVMHPVSFDIAGQRVRPFYTQVSPLWYAAGDEPDRAARTFLAISPGFDGCPDPDGCERAATATFGPPSDRLTYGESVVLVWPHRLFGAE